VILGASFLSSSKGTISQALLFRKGCLSTIYSVFLLKQTSSNCRFVLNCQPVIETPFLPTLTPPDYPPFQDSQPSIGAPALDRLGSQLWKRGPIAGFRGRVEDRQGLRPATPAPH
jgi:hypothetical protein